MSAAALLEKLLKYALVNGLLEESDLVFTRNILLDILRLEAPAPSPYEGEVPDTATSILEPLLDDAVQRGIIGETQTERDLFDTRLMGALIPKPSEVRRKFLSLFENEGITAATDWFYSFCLKANYIRSDRIARNILWDHDSPYGKLTVTINLSKPEKDPKEIAKLKNAPASGYPACMLCLENEGYAGRLNFPARQNHRIIPLTINGDSWYFQYSPYVYYPEHCIVFNEKHVPMNLCRESFSRLLDFSDQFPHYFIGSNAGLPVVGGSILNHDHFQGGNYELPMARAKDRFPVKLKKYPKIHASILHWPMTVLRLRTDDKQSLLNAADQLHQVWWNHSDPECSILAHEPDGTPHNTFTPILRRRNSFYEMDLVLRNNVCTKEFPLGIFHPHAELHHIKRENIGLIEVMGLFILPGRLETELESVARLWAGCDSYSQKLEDPANPLNKHLSWIHELLSRPQPQSIEEARALIRKEVGDICIRVLQDCAVYKEDDAGTNGLKRWMDVSGIEFV